MTNFDNYEGWTDKKLNYEISAPLYKEIEMGNTIFSHKILSTLSCISKNSIIPLVAGSSLPFINKLSEFTIDNHKFEYKQKAEIISATGENIIQLAKNFENAPYLWGGRTVLGIDCSGLSQLVYKIVGIALPRDASMQVNKGESISFITEAQPGDLAFFDNDEGQIIHVGILLNENEIIHASGWVKINSIDHQGIFNTDTNSYSHKLRVIKRIIN